jgi:ribosomal subunit interface protein
MTTTSDTVQIVFRNLPPSEAVEAKIREKVQKLDRFFKNGQKKGMKEPISCKVIVERDGLHHQQGSLYRISVDLSVPGKHLVVSRNPSDRHEHEDVYVAIRDAFDAVKRQLTAFNEKLKAH